MRRTIIRFLLIFNLIGLVIGSTVHFSLYFGWSVYDKSPTLWICLQFAVFVGLIGTLLLKPALRLPKDTYDHQAPLAYIVMAVLVSASFFYTPINYFYCAHKLKEGYPDIVDGQRLLVLYHDAPPQKLSLEQFQQACLYQARKTSGHWMILQLFPLIALYTANKWEKFE